MILDVVIGLAAGAIIGVFFFGGLLWTVRRLPDTRRPTLLAFSSFMVRGLAVAAAIILVSDGRLVRIVTALVGMVVVRTLYVRFVGGLSPGEHTGQGSSSWI